jgi:hypothetical protein
MLTSAMLRRLALAAAILGLIGVFAAESSAIASVFPTSVSYDASL